MNTLARPPRRRGSRRAPAVAHGLVALALGNCLSLAAADSRAAAAEGAVIAGSWATPGFGSIVELRPCASEPTTLCGRIVWLWQPNDEQGRPRLDRNNPERTARARPLLGLEIVRGLRAAAPGVWDDGAIYNPDDGRTYTGDVRARGGVLELRGCALRVFCETQTWRRPGDVIAAVAELGR
jgi:uncharacterized protein (DUF2147 family)